MYRHHVPLSVARSGSSLRAKTFDAGDAVSAGDALLARARKGVELLAHGHVTETGLRETAMSSPPERRNSTVRDRRPCGSISDSSFATTCPIEEAAAGLEHAKDFPKATTCRRLGSRRRSR